MNKLWTPEQRLDAINRVAHLGYHEVDSELFLVIGSLTNASAEYLNNDQETLDILAEAGVN